jgi:hypothetical protein
MRLIWSRKMSLFFTRVESPQSVLMDSKIPFAITHSAGYMFVTDMPSDMGVVKVVLLQYTSDWQERTCCWLV